MNKIKNIALCLLAALSTAMTQSCKENIDTSARYTFTQETVASYLEKHDDYSDYYRLLGIVPISSRSESTVLQLMSARGNYTVFAPDNDAIQNYLDSLYNKGLITEPSWEGFDDEEILDSIQKVIVYNSIIDGGDDTEAYQTSSFPEDTEEFLLANMNDRKLTINYGNNPDSMYINGPKDEDGTVLNGALIALSNRAIYAINGYIHQVHDVVAPSNETLSDLFKSMIETNEVGYLVMAKMLMACGLDDTLSKYRDEAYEELYQTEAISNLATHPTYSKAGYLPEHRKYGFTIFAETDDFWQEQIGKDPTQITMDDIKNWVMSQDLYPDAKTDDAYTTVDNVLNEFVASHILPMRISVDKLVIHYNEKGYYYSTSTRYTVPTWELYTTMGERRLMKLYQCADVDGIYINRFPDLDNGRTGTYHETSCDSDKEGFIINTTEAQNVVNGYIYPISRVNAGPATLAYTEETRENFQKQRLRFDVAGLFPEFMNNDIRANRVSTNANLCVGLPISVDYSYLDDLTIEEGTNFYYLLGLACAWKNYQGDEINVTGRYEMTFRLPPVPKKGTYEIRYAVQNNSSYRGMCQVYFGSDTDNLYAMGIPLDLRIGGTSDLLNWTADTGDDDTDAENDKKMRNNGFMKGPEHYHAGTASSNTARADQYTTRRIIVRQEMDPTKTYYLKFKTVLDDETRQFYMDYIEFCAKEVYDNPNTPEDIW